MAELIVMDECHRTMLVPPTVREADNNAIHQSLNSWRLHERLRAAVHQVLHLYRAVLTVGVNFSR